MCAIEILDYIQSKPIEDAQSLGVRIGIHCGPVIAGVICEKKFAYDLWGDTVNIASRMESHGLPNKIQVSSEFYELTKELFDYEAREPIQIKGKGEMQTYLMEIHPENRK
jgi:adenylate cyclase